MYSDQAIAIPSISFFKRNYNVRVSQCYYNSRQTLITRSMYNVQCHSFTVSGYQSFWVCANRSGAFVDGGMFFSHKTRKLTVPTCGYYQVSSHVLFQSERTTTATVNAPKYVRHELIIKKNCNYAHESDTVILRSYSSLVSTSASYGRTSTHIGDVVKMCEGGTILVNIPSDSSNPCCPYGRSQSTYLSTYMVTNTSCDPSISMDRPPL
jgi:hypothetical protein